MITSWASLLHMKLGIQSQHKNEAHFDKDFSLFVFIYFVLVSFSFIFILISRPFKILTNTDLFSFMM